jgi:predicted transcriptional regulator
MDKQEISIEELAEIMDLSVHTISGYYHGWSKPGKKVRINLIKIFDLEEDEVDD